jgi:hypothetical protein
LNKDNKNITKRPAGKANGRLEQLLPLRMLNVGVIKTGRE